MATFQERFKSLRREKNLTLEELANILGTTKTTLSRYENNKRTPDSEFIRLASKFFGVSTDYLLGETDIRNPYDEFLAQAKEQYGSRGKKQAKELLENIQTMFDGGELPEEDKDEFFRAITEIYFESKEKNRKYTPKKYRKNTSESEK